MIRKLTTILMAAMLVMSISACGGANDKGTSESSASASGSGKSNTENIGTNVAGVLTVGFDQDFPPMGFVGDDGEFTGFDLELAAEAAERLGLELKLQPIAWASKDMELSAKNIDCVWNGFTINGREDKYTWTTPYMSNNQVFVVKADSGIKTLADLAGKVVSVQADSSAEAALAEVPDLMASFGDYIKATDYNNALMDLEAGGVDAVAMDDIVASYQIQKRGSNFALLEEKLAAEEYGVGFLLGNEALRDKIQETLEAMAQDGTLTEISERWFDRDITTIGK